MTTILEEQVEGQEESTRCPYGRLLQILGKPHTLEILYSFGVESPQRFTKLQKSLDIQPKTLSTRLQELVGFGILDRKSFNEIPPRVDYELTSKGEDLGGIFTELHTWSDKYKDSRTLPRKKTKKVRRIPFLT